MTRTPIDYSKSVIYKICCKDPTIEDIYVGSTTNFTKRKYYHKNACNNENNKGYNNYKYQFIRDNGGFSNWDMVLIKDYPTDSKRNLEMEERRIIDELKPTLNKIIPTRTKKEYDKDNKEIISGKKKMYREKNKEKIKQYFEDNKEKLIEKRKEKITCDKCGSIVNKSSLKRHQRTPKCINYN
tara:strand:- start:13 stop:561 length:549 start_codon:yes stop_codon:yes gene_type:complete